MTTPLSFSDQQNLLQLSADERYQYLLTQAIEQQQVWILVGEEGSVLLTNDGQDCIPVWPHEELAESHIQGDWADCRTMAIRLGVWQDRWTAGLTDDGIQVAGFVNDQEEGVIVSPQDFDDDLLSAMQED
ncbi:DUF2750 domain-containing protein [Reinekea blandensis]|uniref:DUF2750 domain-containing protein n=1 Tax=Reinekea blandensis MED297 TaxID=314283 RepID=A4B9X2_9GAMM|nr:DUF2750 domain-containing protein [Reinekea blandensis]EAR11423.1 hypothetical protein MED297_21087 [Reinekea sp. MED297] [Reinekea blandensis MED297]